MTLRLNRMPPPIWDIIPDAEGWAVLMNGRCLACYPSLHLAMDWVEKQAGKSEHRVVRQLGADGRFYDAQTGALLASDPASSAQC